MKHFFVMTTLSMFVLSGAALADVGTAKRDANHRIDRSEKALESVRVCVSQANSEMAVTECRVDIFPVSAKTQRMEERTEEIHKKK